MCSTIYCQAIAHILMETERGTPVGDTGIFAATEFEPCGSPICALYAEEGEAGFHLIPAAEHSKGTRREQALSGTDEDWTVTWT